MTSNFVLQYSRILNILTNSIIAVISFVVFTNITKNIGSSLTDYAVATMICITIALFLKISIKKFTFIEVTYTDLCEIIYNERISSDDAKLFNNMCYEKAGKGKDLNNILNDKIEKLRLENISFNDYKKKSYAVFEKHDKLLKSQYNVFNVAKLIKKNRKNTGNVKSFNFI